MKFLDWLIERLSENSTWRGIILTATAAGIIIDEKQSAAIIATGLALVGLINVFRKGGATKADVEKAIDLNNKTP